jgi:MoaA/NifB/PqqE/SkfB family radical SAM enzyme
MQEPNLTITGNKPLDQSDGTRPHRIYAALTNHCNRACPWCSACSSPRGDTWLRIDDFLAALPSEGTFEVQLEGGEPTVHPDFWEYVRLCLEHPRCSRLVLVTNGAMIPRSSKKLDPWLARLGEKFTIKLSINHYLLDHDKGLIELAALLSERIEQLGGERMLVLNVRLRKGIEDDDARILKAVEDAGLLPVSNVFFLQRYGFAEEEEDWALPHVVDDNFNLLNPDGRAYGNDILARSEALREMANKPGQSPKNKLEVLP